MSTTPVVSTIATSPVISIPPVPSVRKGSRVFACLRRCGGWLVKLHGWWYTTCFVVSFVVALLIFTPLNRDTASATGSTIKDNYVDARVGVVIDNVQPALFGMDTRFAFSNATAALINTCSVVVTVPILSGVLTYRHITGHNTVEYICRNHTDEYFVDTFGNVTTHIIPWHPAPKDLTCIIAVTVFIQIAMLGVVAGIDMAVACISVAFLHITPAIVILTATSFVLMVIFAPFIHVHWRKRENDTSPKKSD
jgi:hypothetical protein